MGLCSQIDLDFEVNRAAKDRPAMAEDRGQTLAPAELTTAGPEDDYEREHASEADVFGARHEHPAEDQEDEVDVNSVFSRLKDYKAG